MSPSNALQKAIFEILTAALPCPVYDPPPLMAPYPYASFGPSLVQREDVDCIDTRVCILQIDVWSSALDGSRECNALTDATMAALDGADADLEPHALASLDVILTRVMRDPDGKLTHGVVQVRAVIEEA